MKRRALGASLAVGCILASLYACGEDERNYRTVKSPQSLPKDSGDATGDAKGETPSVPGEDTPDNTSTLPSKPSQLGWDGSSVQGDANYNVFPTE